MSCVLVSTSRQPLLRRLVHSDRYALPLVMLVSLLLLLDTLAQLYEGLVYLVLVSAGTLRGYTHW